MSFPSTRSRYLSNPWVIRTIAHDFELVDAWDLEIAGSRPDAPTLFEVVAKELGGAKSSGRLTSALFALRGVVANLFGWDEETNCLPIPGCQEASLRDRCEQVGIDPPAMRDDVGFFRVVYITKAEYALETSNRLLHAVMHVGWAPAEGDQYAAQMGVWVKYRTRMGRVYLAAIAPGRHWVVYPALMRRLGAAWERHRTEQLQGVPTPQSAS